MATQQHKKADQVDVKTIKNILLKSLIICGLLLSFSCSSNRELIAKHKGRYEYHLLKGSIADSAVVTGHLFDLENNKPLSTNGAIKIADAVVARIDASGYFNFKIKPGRYRLIATGFPYHFIETKNIQLASGDTLMLEAHLMFESKTRD